jgi:hypothetical protein
MSPVKSSVTEGPANDGAGSSSATVTPADAGTVATTETTSVTIPNAAMNRLTTTVPFLSNDRSVEADPGGEKDRTGAGEIPPCHPDGIHATP